MRKIIVIPGLTVVAFFAIIGILSLIIIIKEGYLTYVLHGPKIVLTESSLDGKFSAYVEEEPSIDPPKQALYIEHKDLTRYKFIARLAEDVDHIKKIEWSPNSDMVIFQTYYYLIAVSIPDYHTVMISLGGEWVRSQPKRKSTFAVAGTPPDVEEIRFPETGVVRYRLSNTKDFRTVSIPSGRKI